MLKTILDKLGLVTKKECAVYIKKCASLSSKVVQLETNVERLTLDKQSWVKVTQETTAELNQVNIDKTFMEKEFKDYEQTRSEYIETLLQSIKNLKRKNDRLLSKQGSYKARIGSLNADKHNLSIMLENREKAYQKLSEELTGLRSKLKYYGILEPSDITKLLQTAKEESTKAEFWRLYSEKVVDKLEYLCFGSVLPNVMRYSSLTKYQHLFKPVKLEYFTQGDNSSVVASYE